MIILKPIIWFILAVGMLQLYRSEPDRAIAAVWFITFIGALIIAGITWPDIEIDKHGIKIYDKKDKGE